MTDRRDWLDLFGGAAKGEVTLPLLSGSMAPALLPGDQLLVRPLGEGRPRIGDVVVFRRGPRVIAHRLVFAFSIGGLSILLERGDAMEEVSLLPRGSVVGRVEGASRGGESVYSRTPGSRAVDRRYALRVLLRYIFLKAPIAATKRILRRDA